MTHKSEPDDLKECDYLEGRIADVKVFDRALSDDEIKRLARGEAF